MKLSTQQRLREVKEQKEKAERLHKDSSSVFSTLLHHLEILAAAANYSMENTSDSELTAGKIEELFDSLANHIRQTISPESVENFCKEINLLPEDTPKENLLQCAKAELEKRQDEVSRLKAEKDALKSQVRVLRSSVAKFVRHAEKRKIEIDESSKISAKIVLEKTVGADSEETDYHPVKSARERSAEVKAQSVQTDVKTRDAKSSQTQTTSVLTGPTKTSIIREAPTKESYLPIMKENTLGLREAGFVSPSLPNPLDILSNPDLSRSSNHSAALSPILFRAGVSEKAFHERRSTLQEIKKSIEELAQHDTVIPSLKKSTRSSSPPPRPAKLNDEQDLVDFSTLRMMSELSLQQTAEVLSQYYSVEGGEYTLPIKIQRNEPRDLGISFEDQPESPEAADDDGEIDLDSIRDMTKKSLQRTADLVKSFYSKY